MCVKSNYSSEVTGQPSYFLSNIIKLIFFSVNLRRTGGN